MPDTPTGRLIAQIDPLTRRTEWLALRRTGIGSSDIPAILDVSDYTTPLEVYLDKTGALPLDDEGSEAARWGNLLEDIIARDWSRRHGLPIAATGTIAHLEHPWRLANVDRLVYGCPIDGEPTPGDMPLPVASCILEVKNRNAYAGGKWRDDVPDDVLAQVAWQLHVTGYDHAHVAALIGGNRAVDHVVTRDPDLETYIVGRADAMWQRIAEKDPPLADPTAALIDLLDRLHPDRAGIAVAPPETVAWLTEDYARDAALRVAAAAIEQERDEIKARAVIALGSAQELVDEDNAPLYVYKPQLRGNVDTDTLKRDYPDAYAATYAKRPTRPVLYAKAGIKDRALTIFTEETPHV